MEERRNVNIKSPLNHSVVIENRERINLTGVIDIHSFDDELALVETELGILMIKGDNLKMNKLNLENNELIIEGKIAALNYSDSAETKKGNMFNKLFR
ncbi:MAG: sporulation protein YabP [Clostridia bacterium]